MQFDWDPKKNDELKEQRGISFEEIALLLGSGVLWKVTGHWNPEKFPNQSVFLLPIDGYIHAVPFVRNEETIFLKTAFPSRKLTRLYKAEQEQKP
ncbi:MAG: hypothetical protein NWT08_02330 [Akkermansiaceae bacterium]|nr:hypothetical protein [Akkermansiaceae bacterium]MDP4646241.1 hypothetical protein [Akkermansiaceae bacterium]MDP4720277.1 hypothetical protein [Akkermansiaceae bacterium]MDP4779918.1 hypothetical protein [Akkermansiaceae bacterium]MDP4845885.1 hypothetical protein [Akkermansiaceae bacterium]